MIPLKQDFIDSCPLEGGFRMRGLEMTRIEVFVDTALTTVLGFGWFPYVRSRRLKTAPQVVDDWPESGSDS